MKSKRNSGFVALLAAIIISAVLVGTSFTMSQTQFYARIGTLNQSYKLESRELASSCVRVALEDILENYSYHPASAGEMVIVGSNSCTITSVISDPEDAVTHYRVTTIETVANSKGSVTHLQVKVSVHNPGSAPVNSGVPAIKIISWIEI